MPALPLALVVVTALAAVGPAGKPGAVVSWKDAHKQIEAAAGAALRTAEGGRGWSARVTPPLPSVWPPDGRAGLVAYAYAARFSPGLSDGEKTAGTWARVVLEDGAPVVKDVTPLRPLGVQGGRPLQDGELEIARSDQAAIAELEAAARGKKLPDAPLVRKYYCFWRSTNGVIAEDLEGRHAAFFRWLACQP
jgi:hypothetical protein